MDQHIGSDEVGAPFCQIVPIQSITGNTVAWIPAHHDVHAFVDTLHVEVKRPVFGAQREDLRRLCRGVEQRRPDRVVCSKWRRVLHIQNPSRGALEWLRDELGSGGTITRVDVSLDLTVISEDAAQRLQQFFERHLMQRWRGKRKTRPYETTRYWADTEKVETRNLAVYSDKLSKISGTPCCHIECRICTADACRRKGLGTFQELFDLDYHTFWQRELYLKAIDRARLERAIDRRGRELLSGNPPPSIVRNLEIRSGQTRRQAIREKISGEVARLLNVLPSDLHLVDAQDLKDVAAWLADKCLVIVPNDPFLKMLARYDSVQD